MRCCSRASIELDDALIHMIVSTICFGYFFQSYHDFGWLTSVPNLTWNRVFGTNGKLFFVQYREQSSWQVLKFCGRIV